MRRRSGGAHPPTPGDAGPKQVEQSGQARNASRARWWALQRAHQRVTSCCAPLCPTVFDPCCLAAGCLPRQRCNLELPHHRAAPYRNPAVTHALGATARATGLQRPAVPQASRPPQSTCGEMHDGSRPISTQSDCPTKQLLKGLTCALIDAESFVAKTTDRVNQFCFLSRTASMIPW